MSGRPPKTVLMGLLAIATAWPREVAMSAAKPCANDNMNRSKCMIELVLDDVVKEYGGIDSGGIDMIKAPSTTSLAVSISLEERVVTWTYEFDVKDGSVAVKNKTESTQSYGR